jgi:predicted DNA-binding protein
VLSTNKLKQQLEELKEELSTTNDPTIRSEIEDDIYNIEELLSCPQSARVKIILSPNPSL